LRRLNVPTVIVEKNERPGDSWRKRYKSLCLHDPVWYDHLPFLPFPEHWPVFSPKDKIGDWLEMYTKVMELNYWGGTECTSAAYDKGNAEWKVEVVRKGRRMTLRPRQLVLAAREEDPGLQCELYAIVPLPPEPMNDDEDDEAEPWAASVTSSSYEKAVAENAREDESGERPMAAVLLGSIVRFKKDRKHPESLPLETMDVLAKIVSGRVVEAVDKVLEDLLGP